MAKKKATKSKTQKVKKQSRTEQRELAKGVKKMDKRLDQGKRY